MISFYRKEKEKKKKEKKVANKQEIWDKEEEAKKLVPKLFHK